MAKRLTATEKWTDAWFCSLTSDEKIIWLYLLDVCDHAGIWEVNWLLAKFHFNGYTPEWNPDKFKGRIFAIEDGTHWFVPKFLAFQYKGDLDADNRVHQAVITRLKKHGLWPLSLLQKKEKTPLPWSWPLAEQQHPKPPDPSPPHPRAGAEAKEKDKAKATALVLEKATATEEATVITRAPANILCDYCGPIRDHDSHKKCHYCFEIFQGGRTSANHTCR